MAPTHPPDGARSTIRAELARRSIPHADAAAALGLSPKAFGRRLSGRVRMDVAEVEALAAWLGVAPSVLLAEPAGSAA